MAALGRGAAKGVETPGCSGPTSKTFMNSSQVQGMGSQIDNATSSWCCSTSRNMGSADYLGGLRVEGRGSRASKNRISGEQLCPHATEMLRDLWARSP